MSSYLSIYIVPKRKSDKEKKKHIILAAYSRNTEIYQYFSENINPTYIGNGKEPSYTTLTKGNISFVLADFDKDINSAKNKLTEYEKYVASNPEYIQEILDIREYISDLQYWKDKTSFIEDIINDADIYKVIEEVCCNID